MHFTKPDAGKTISLEHEGFVGKLERVVDTDSLCIIIDIDPKKLSWSRWFAKNNGRSNNNARFYFILFFQKPHQPW